MLTKWSQIEPYTDTLYIQSGKGEAAKMLNRLAKLCARWLGLHRGFR